MNWWLRHADSGVAIAPSLLSADFGDLAGELDSLTVAGADIFHLDVMDGHFVPNITFGPFIAAAIRKRTELLLDTHLMLERPDLFVAPFADAGVEALTVHVEADCDIEATLDAIADRGLRTGVSLNPDTSLDLIRPYLCDLDLVLVMSVQPGFGGQSFREEALAKIRALVEARSAKGWEYAISVDGGVSDVTAPACREAGADILVSGSWLVRSADRKAATSVLRGS